MISINLRGRGAACVLGVLLVAALSVSVYRITRVRPAMTDFSVLPTIIIDPGHGGEDGGAVDNGVIEDEVNLAVCLALRDMFAINGFEVVMTRDSDISIHDEGVKGTRKQKTSDLKNRLAISEKHPNSVFISVHQKTVTNPKSWGTQVFYGPKNPASERLANAMQKDFARELQPDNTRGIKKADKNLFLMYQAQCPAVLVECGFLSNPNDAALLSDPEYQQKVAFTIFGSVIGFIA
jgi:N-acetylmuramoyl-L-alanine amidase